MEKLKAFPIEDLGMKLQLQGDLLYHEGPFYKWTDCDDTCNRWLIFKISVEKLHDFFEQKVNLLQLIKQNPFVYLIDLDNDLNQKSLFFCQKQNIPEGYLPSEKSFFKEIQYEKYALLLKEKLNKSLTENDLFEIVLRELSTLKSNQKGQDKLLQSIWNRLDGQTKVQNIKNGIEESENIVERLSRNTKFSSDILSGGDISIGDSIHQSAEVIVINEDSEVEILAVSEVNQDLTVIEGIGPKIMVLLNQAGISTFKELAITPIERLSEILISGGSRYKMHNPATWPRQAYLASIGRWEELKDWQDKLNTSPM